MGFTHQTYWDDECSGDEPVGRSFVEAIPITNSSPPGDRSSASRLSAGSSGRWWSVATAVMRSNCCPSSSGASKTSPRITVAFGTVARRVLACLTAWGSESMPLTSWTTSANLLTSSPSPEPTSRTFESGPGAAASSSEW